LEWLFLRGYIFMSVQAAGFNEIKDSHQVDAALLGNC
jgi:hypothetical protein